MSHPTANPEHIRNARLDADILDTTQQEPAFAQCGSSDENEQVISKRNGKDEGDLDTSDAHEPAVSQDCATEEREHLNFGSTTAKDPSTSSTDNGSTYYSAQSQFSFRSIFTRSTGKHSQNGATWRQVLTNTMNSGFGSGTRVREGREKGGYLPPVTGVGRTGKHLRRFPIYAESSWCEVDHAFRWKFGILKVT